MANKVKAGGLQDRVRVLVRPRSLVPVTDAPESKMALRRVRTPEGAQRFGQPIGSIIRGTLDELAARGGPGYSSHYETAHSMDDLEQLYGTHRWSSGEFGDGFELMIFANDDEDPTGVLLHTAAEAGQPESEGHYSVFWDGWTDNNEQFRGMLDALDRVISDTEDWADLEEENELDRELDPDDPDDAYVKERTDRIDNDGVVVDREGGPGVSLLSIEEAHPDLPIYFGLEGYLGDELIEMGFLDDETREPLPYQTHSDDKLELTLDQAREMREAFDAMWSRIDERYESEDEDEEDDDSGVQMLFVPDGKQQGYLWQDHNQGGRIQMYDDEDWGLLINVIERASLLPAPHRDFRPFNASQHTPEEVHAFRTGQAPPDPPISSEDLTDLEEDYGIVVRHHSDGDITVIDPEGDELLIDRDKVQGYLGRMRALLAAPEARMEQVE